MAPASGDASQGQKNIRQDSDFFLGNGVDDAGLMPTIRPRWNGLFGCGLGKPSCFWRAGRLLLRMLARYRSGKGPPTLTKCFSLDRTRKTKGSPDPKRDGSTPDEEMSGWNRFRAARYVAGMLRELLPGVRHCRRHHGIDEKQRVIWDHATVLCRICAGSTGTIQFFRFDPALPLLNHRVSVSS